MALNGRRVFLLLPWLIVGAIVVTLGWWQLRAPEPAQLVACPDLRAGCAFQTPAGRVAVRVEGDLRMLKPFLLRVEATAAQSVQAQFTMDGMDMGFNRYALQRKESGVFEGRIVLPVCVSGRRDWLMSLEIDGHRIDLPFVTGLS